MTGLIVSLPCRPVTEAKSVYRTLKVFLCFTLLSFCERNCMVHVKKLQVEFLVCVIRLTGSIRLSS